LEEIYCHPLLESAKVKQESPVINKNLVLSAWHEPCGKA
jgi:hypothetical protein